MKTSLAVAIAGIAGLPLAAILTWILHPFWRWFEFTTAIEAIGHSGPATWCYVAVYFSVIMIAASALLIFRKKHREAAQDSASPSS